MGNIRYVVNYGAPFNIRSRTFKTEYEAKVFIREHIFGDRRFCSLEKVEELDVDFEYMPHYEIEDRELQDKMFHNGIIERGKLV